MRGFKLIILIVVALIVVSAGGFTLYSGGYATGSSNGYERGYPSGKEAGYYLGKTEGYDEGKSAGYDEGKFDGYKLGKSEGYTDGFNLGEAEGYSHGYKEGLSVGSLGFTLRDPTFKEAVTFIAEDVTNYNEYNKDTYVCSHFARDVCNNAEQRGLRSAFVEIRFTESGHAIVGFNTTDKGMVYFDTETDDMVVPVVGKRYYQCVITTAGYFYETPAFDDTIKDILVIW